MDCERDSELELHVADYLAAGADERGLLEKRWLSEDPELYSAVARRVDLLGAFGMHSSADLVPERIGDYPILGRIGWGGMGVVYAARDPASGRELALKRLPFERLLLPGAAQRFAREIEAVQRLDHPGIVAVLSVDTQASEPFFTMERVRGVSLAAVLHAFLGSDPTQLTARDLECFLRERSPESGGGGSAAGESRASVYEGVERVEPEDEAQAQATEANTWVEAVLRLVQQVAEALEHAHSRGVVHRDVKPGNILCTPDGRAHVIDFGLADTGDSQELTRTDALIGSLPYMSPEQVRAEHAAVGPRSDVYSLGVVLFELCSLREAFPRRSREALIDAVLRGDVPPLRRVHAGLDRDLETICGQAMRLEAGERYASASAFARDLGARIAGLGIRARPASVLARTKAFVVRHPHLWSAGRAATAAIFVSLFVLGWREWRADQALELERIRAQAFFERSEWAAVAAVDVLLALDPTVSPAENRSDVLEEACAKLRGTLGDYPDNLAFALQAVGSTQLNLGRVARAEALLREATDLYDRAGFTRGRYRSRVALGELLTLREDFELAQQTFDEALGIEPDAAFDAGQQEPASLRLAWAELKLARGACNEAERYARDALQHLGERSGELQQRGLRLLIDAQRIRGDSVPAEALAKELPLAGAGALEQALLACTHAGLARARGDSAGADEALRRSLASLEALFREGHPLVDRTRFELGLALCRCGEAEGLELLRQAEAGMRATLAEGAPSLDRARAALEACSR